MKEKIKDVRARTIKLTGEAAEKFMASDWGCYESERARAFRGKGDIEMKTSEKLLQLALEVENLCEDINYDFNESFDQQFGEIRREIETLELRISEGQAQ